MIAPCLAFLALFASPAEPAVVRVELEVDTGGRVLRDVPLAWELRRGVELPADADLSQSWRAVIEVGNMAQIAQTEPLFDGDGSAPVGLVVRWVEAALGDDVSRRTVVARPAADDVIAGGFAFRRDATRLELFRGERLVWRHERGWDPDRYEETYKPFHHLGDLHGETFLTKGAGGLYPHHRGLFVGWGKSRAGEETFDFWHMPATRAHQEYAGEDRRREAAGVVFARSVSTTSWVTADGATPVEDVRDLVAYALDEGRLFDLEVTVRATTGPVRLDGDPAHAGVQLRLAQSVAEAKAAEYVFPESATGGEGDNWSDCPWVAVRFPIGERRYEVLFLDHPRNPRPTVFNTRAYGRFGPFFCADVTPDAPLVVRYRLLVRELGDEPASVPELARAHDAWANPPIVRLRRE